MDLLKIDLSNLFVDAINLQLNLHEAMGKEESDEEVSITVTSQEESNLMIAAYNSRQNSRRGSNTEIRDLVLHNSTQRPSQLYLQRPSIFVAQRKFIIDLFASKYGSSKSLNTNPGDLKEKQLSEIRRKKNRRMGNDALTIVLSALYAKFLFVLGITLPIANIVSDNAPGDFYNMFYLYLYIMSILFILFVYVTHIRNRKYFDIIENYEQRSGDTKLSHKKRVIRYGSFYLRVGSIAFGIGSMVYSGLEFGQYFELKADNKCQNIFIALNPAFRILLIIMQMQLIFLNTKELNMMQNKVVSRFGLMHLVATNLCEWVHVLVDETKHEIDNLIMYQNHTNSTLHVHKRSLDMDVRCSRTNIMGRLVQNASPFLFPCTVEYSLIGAVILYEMWKKIRKETDSQRQHHESLNGFHEHKDVHTLSLDCSKAHRGMFCGILVTVLTIISLIMFFVLEKEKKFHKTLAVLEVTYCEIILYIITSIAVILGMYKMRDLKFSKFYLSGIGLDCTLLVIAQSGVYIYSMFSIMGCYFTIDMNNYSKIGLASESLSFIQTTLQTIFILNSWWRRIKKKDENHSKPGREVVTFLLVANMAIWFINALVKGHAAFRPTHLVFFGQWTWVIITHLSMPLAIFYRFHSTICLFEIWKISYKLKNNDDEESHKS